MEDGQARILQLLRVAFRIARRGGDELHALVDDELHDVRVAHEGLGDVDPKGLVGELAHLQDFAAHGVEFPRRGFDDAERSGIGDRRGERRTGDPAHGSLHDGSFHTQHAGNAIVEGSGMSVLHSRLASKQKEDSEAVSQRAAVYLSARMGTIRLDCLNSLSRRLAAHQAICQNAHRSTAY